MEVPPGPVYAIRILLRALPVSIAGYGIFSLLANYSGVAAPRWSLIVMSLMAYPTVSFIMEKWKAYRNQVNAAAHGAVLAPRVLTGGFAIREALIKSIQSGYPGACYIS